MSARRRARSDKINIRHYGPGRLRLPLRFAARRKVAVPVLSWLAAGGRWIRTLGPPVEDGAWTASAELREVPAGQLRFAPDSPLEGDGFELPVPRTTPGFWPISTRTTRRDRCRKKGVRIRQLLVCAALGREWWARRRSVLSVSDPRERAAREPAGADRAPSSPSSARCASNRMLPAPGCVSRRS